MKSKKTPPLSGKVSSKKPTNAINSNKRRPKWWLAIILLVLFTSYLVWVWSNTIDEDNTTSTTSMQSTAQQTESTQSASVPLDDDVSTVTTDENQDNANITDSNIPDPTAILEAPLPETDSLAKEEIDRLEDERKRLAEQEKIAAEQVAMTKQLTELKAEEIELLEQQIAQLEANKDAKNTTE